MTPQGDPAPDVPSDPSPDEALRLLTELEETLAAEYEALRQRDVEALESAVARKAGLLAELESAAGKICRPGKPLPPALRALADACAERNRANGGAIAMNQGLVGGVLDVLYGVKREARTYGARGRLDGVAATRSVARA